MEKLTQMVQGRKYTVVSMGEFGFPYQMQMTLVKVKVEPYAQYGKSYVLEFKQPKKRLNRMLRFYGDRPLIVWEGWVNPKTDMYIKSGVKDYSSGAVTIQESLPCFDLEYLRIARYSVQQEPFFSNCDSIRPRDPQAAVIRRDVE